MHPKQNKEQKRQSNEAVTKKDCWILRRKKSWELDYPNEVNSGKPGADDSSTWRSKSTRKMRSRRKIVNKNSLLSSGIIIWVDNTEEVIFNLNLSYFFFLFFSILRKPKLFRGEATLDRPTNRSFRNFLQEINVPIPESCLTVELIRNTTLFRYNLSLHQKVGNTWMNFIWPKVKYKFDFHISILYSKATNSLEGLSKRRDGARKDKKQLRRENRWNLKVKLNLALVN